MRLYVQTNNDQALLVVKDAKREDSGPYTVVLKNPSGSADATIKVTVIGTTLLHSVTYLLNNRRRRCDSSGSTHSRFASTKRL